jgi:putative ABC transport system substrate-binding protein
MRRREFITLVGGAALASTSGAHAQRGERTRQVSVLLGVPENDPETKSRVRAFQLGMRDAGWINGRNVQIEYRYAGTDPEAIKKHIAELIPLAPDVILANSSPIVALLRSATNTIPIVFVVVNDPVGQGFIPNLAHPGGNVTGFSFIEPEIVGKWINLLGDVKPDLARVALMYNPNTAAYYDSYLRSFKALPQQVRVGVDAAPVRNTAEIEQVVAEVARDERRGLIVAADPYIVSMRELILKLAEQHRVLLLAPYRQFAVDGGLMSYGPDTADIFRRSSSYVDRVLKGELPGNLPAQSPDKFELVFNLRRAKALGLSVAEPFLQLADEVLE